MIVLCLIASDKLGGINGVLARLLCWPAGLASPIHDHAEASCWMKILAGTMLETRYQFPGDDVARDADLDAAHRNGQLHETKRTELRPEAVAYIDDSLGIHRMGNASTLAPAVSLHIYSPPIHRCRVFDESSAATREVSLGCANAAQNPFTTSDLALGGRVGDVLETSLISCNGSPLPTPNATATVADLIARLREMFKPASSSSSQSSSSSPPASSLSSSSSSLTRLAASMRRLEQSQAVSHLLATARLASDEWDEYVHFSEQRYVRVLLGFNESFSLVRRRKRRYCLRRHFFHHDNNQVLNCWLPGQTTPVHEHAERDAYVRVVAGALRLQHYDSNGNVTQTDELNGGGCRYYGGRALGQHTLGTAGDEAAVSLHVYSPPMLALECAHEKSVPVVWCSKALAAPSGDDEVLARAAAGRVYGSLQTFVGALARALAAAELEQPAACPVLTLLRNFTLSEAEVAAHAASGTTRWLVGVDERFSVVIRFWPTDDRRASAPHAHARSRTYVKLLHGRFENLIYANASGDDDEPSRVDAYNEGDVVEMSDPSVVHAMRCVSAAASLGVTLHVFTPPLDLAALGTDLDLQ
jgi:predicted metal-dependent enzyme (double-stranded beta helix superfamily)